MNRNPSEVAIPSRIINPHTEAPVETFVAGGVIQKTDESKASEKLREYMKQQIRRKIAIEAMRSEAVMRELITNSVDHKQVSQMVDFALAIADDLIAKTGGHGD